MTKTIFFDFDGVIVDSTRIKTEAFYELFLEHGEEKAQMAQTYHLQNEGVDRYAKINHICENILNQPHDQQKEERYAKQFSHLVFEKVLKCGFIPGALEFLNSLYKHKVPCFLLSATPEA